MSGIRISTLALFLSYFPRMCFCYDFVSDLDALCDIFMILDRCMNEKKTNRILDWYRKKHIIQKSICTIPI